MRVSELYEGSQFKTRKRNECRQNTTSKGYSGTSLEWLRYLVGLGNLLNKCSLGISNVYD